MIDQVCYIFVTVREAVFGKDYMPEFCGGTYSVIEKIKSYGGVRSIQFIGATKTW